MATCVAYFMLFGEHRKYRAGFVRLCERVHKHRADAKAFDECFPGVDRKQLQRQFIRFVSGTHYAYFGVPQALFDEFVTATSKGRFFGQRIRSQFRFKRLAT